jgi:hypothetical protein
MHTEITIHYNKHETMAHLPIKGDGYSVLLFVLLQKGVQFFVNPLSDSANSVPVSLHLKNLWACHAQHEHRDTEK